MLSRMTGKMTRLILIAAAFAAMGAVSTLSGQNLNVEYEKVLIPIAVSQPLPGSFGSLWITHLLVTNTTNTDVYAYNQDLYNGNGGQATLEGCCPPLPANSTVELSYLDAPVHRGSRFYFIDKRFIDRVQVSLRVQDLSRQSQTWGTAIPVVRERQFVNDIRSLNDVPVDTTSRLTLRIYSLEGAQPATVRVSVYGYKAVPGENRPPDVLLGVRDFALQTFTAEGNAGANPFPGYLEIAQLDTITPVSGYKRVRVDVAPLDDHSRIWAFASITNDETQHVTVIAPSP